ncbi:MAG: four helix bundle protein [Ignavibacteriae bacterium]|nr:four helix bundle protein [Ignavibacteriota bacterium]
MATGLENLWIYKLAEDLEVKVYEVTKVFPRDEFYRSVDQLRRSSSSVSDNLAEHYHKTTVKEKVRFLNIAKGEMEETRRGIIKSARKKFLSDKLALELVEQYTVLMKGTTSYIRFLELNNIGKRQTPTTKD